MLALLLTSFNLLGQTSYSGFIDKNPIVLVVDVYSGGEANAIYVYSKYNEPIVIKGERQKNKLILFEKDKKNKPTAKFIFENFDSKIQQMQGVWTDLKDGKKFNVKLTKMFDLDYGDSIEWKDKEILQPVSIGSKYFKIIVSKSKQDFEPKVTGIKIIEKKTNELIQQISLDCQLWGLHNIDIGDYNFDGKADFSIFEHSYAGPNTSSLYFLYDKKTDKYFNSGYEGSSLDFDSKRRRIYEHNQCCAGNSQMNAEYKVVNNKMILVSKTCTEYNEKKKDFIKVKCE